MTGRYQDRVVVVTGASAGVGRATAIAFAREGASVALLARGQHGLDGAARDVVDAGGRALTISVDVSDADAIEQAAERIEQELGPIDVWVNNAMVTVFSPIHELHADEVRRVTEVTYLGYVHGTLSALTRMRRRDRGVIVQVGSALAYRSIPLQGAYCASKAAIRGFTDSLHCELRHDRSNVRLTTVHMPALNTPQFDWVRNRMPRRAQPVPPIFEPEVAAEAIVFAAGHPRREFWVGRSTVLAILSARLAPGIGDRYLARSGYRSQQRDEPASNSAQRIDNLWHAADNGDGHDYGAHGDFDQQAAAVSWQSRAAQHRALASLTLVGAAGLAVAAGIAQRHAGRSA